MFQWHLPTSCGHDIHCYKKCLLSTDTTAAPTDISHTLPLFQMKRVGGQCSLQPDSHPGLLCQLEKTSAWVPNKRLLSVMATISVWCKVIFWKQLCWYNALSLLDCVFGADPAWPFSFASLSISWSFALCKDDMFLVWNQFCLHASLWKILLVWHCVRLTGWCLHKEAIFFLYILH